MAGTDNMETMVWKQQGEKCYGDSFILSETKKEQKKHKGGSGAWPAPILTPPFF